MDCCLACTKRVGDQGGREREERRGEREIDKHAEKEKERGSPIYFKCAYM